MPGRARAVSNGEELKSLVVEVATRLGLDSQTEVRVGRRIWGSTRKIDVVLTYSVTRLKLGVECKYQGTLGTAEEKIPAIVQDIKAWPIRGIIAIGGIGFSANMRGYLISTGVVVEYEDLEDWLKLYFAL